MAAIKRYTADADNTITNAFRSNLITRGTGSNMGASDILEVFSIYGQASGSSGEGTALSQELSRILINFPVSDIETDRSGSSIPASGSVKFYLKMFNVPHGETTPTKYTLVAAAVSQSWHEGSGKDMENYSDLTHNVTGSNWIYRSGSNSTTARWNTAGGKYHLDLSSSFTQYFEGGTEDLELDITTLVEQWMHSAGNVLPNKRGRRYGLGIMLTASQEAYFSSSTQSPTGSDNAILFNPSGSKRSYYTKRFFGRKSEFFFKRPVIEARWNDSRKDDRGSFYFSSSLLTTTENLNQLYLYNYYRGQLRNIPGIGTKRIYVSIYSGSSVDSTSKKITLPVGGGVTSTQRKIITGSYVSTGIYSCSFAMTASSTTSSFDVWHSKSGTPVYHTGSFTIKKHLASSHNPAQSYISNISNLRKVYFNNETARFRLYTRPKDWSPTIYSVAKKKIENNIIDSASYQIFRVSDDYVVVPFGTSSTTLHTMMSYDVSGNYFDFNMSHLEPDYAYGIKFAYYNGAVGSWIEQPNIFKFRVEKTK